MDVPGSTWRTRGDLQFRYVSVGLLSGRALISSELSPFDPPHPPLMDPPDEQTLTHRIAYQHLNDVSTTMHIQQ